MFSPIMNIPAIPRDNTFCARGICVFRQKMVEPANDPPKKPKKFYNTDP